MEESQISKFETIKTNIVSTKLKDALLLLKNLVDDTADTENKNLVIQLLARYNTLSKQINSNTINDEAANTERNKIIKAILDITSEIEENSIQTSTQNTKNNSQNEVTINKIESTVETVVVKLEIQKLKYEYYQSSINDRRELISKIKIYQPFINNEVLSFILDFLFELAYSINRSEEEDIALSIYSLIHSIFPPSVEKEEEFSMKVIDQLLLVGESLVANSLFNTNNMKTAAHGLSIWKYVHIMSLTRNYSYGNQKVKLKYAKMKYLFEGDSKLENHESKYEILNIFENDLNESTMIYPNLPQELTNLI